MSRPKVVVTRRWHPEVEAALMDRFDTQLNEDDHSMSVAELQDALRSADAVLPTVCDKVTAEVLGVDDIRAKILGSNGVGFNHIDLDAAKAAGLTVTNTPEVLTDCTADLAMTLLLTVARRAGEGERHLRNGEWTGWRPTHMMGTSVTGKTLGLIGMGRIARAVAARAAHGFNMKIIYHDPFPPRDEDIADLNASRCASPEEVFAQADIPEDKILVPGVIDSTTNFVEHPRLVAQRITRFADIVGRERVIAGTDCGFSTFAGFGAVDEDIVYAKLGVMVEGAAIASAELWGR